MNNDQLNFFFPIASQTSNIDKFVLLKIMKFIGLKKNKYSYLEIGSFLGGSLTPFLRDKKCKKILSIDKRNQVLDDERHEKWSYKKIPCKLMIENLKKNNLDISKLKTFDGDVSNFSTKNKFDLVFIDGVHTDTNTFSDFLHSLDIVHRNSIILFHDSDVIFKALNLINIFLKKNKYIFKILKFKKSEITGIFMGTFEKIKIEKKDVEQFEKFIKKANENLLIHQLNSRINIKFKISRFLKGKPPYKFFLKPIEKKNV